MAEEKEITSGFAASQILVDDKKVIQVGEKVNKSDFKDDFDRWVEVGVVVEKKEDAEPAPISGTVGSIIEAEERSEQEEAIAPEEGAVRARSRT